MTTEEIKELWGEDLFKVFGNYIDNNGFLTEEWGEIVEENLSDLDEDYNDTDEKKEIYSKMYNTDFEDNEDLTKIRPKTIYKIKCFKVFTEKFEYMVSAYHSLQACSFIKGKYGVKPLKVLEIPESEWHEKTINIWEDNNFSKEPFKISINESISDEIQLISSTDLSLID